MFSSEMEKSVAASSKKVSNHITDDIAFLILSKLPLKSLKRFGCVRKSWGSLFENSYFMNIYRSHFESRNLYSDGKPLLVDFGGNPYTLSVHLLSGDKFENKVELNLPSPILELGLVSFWIIGSRSINGTLCLSCYFDERNSFEAKAVLWNPASEEFKVIPPSSFESIPNGRTHILLHGFGYDHLRNDYKVIRSVDYDEVTFDDIEFLDYSAKDMPWDPFWEIYSLRSNSWKKINVDLHIFPTIFPNILPSELCQIYMDGMCHWWLPDYNNKEYLLSFDLHNEVLFTTPFPSYLDDFRPVSRSLETLNESIALIAYDYLAYYLHVLILGEVGVEESWTKLFVVGPFYDVMCLIRVVKNDHIIFQKDNGELVLFNESTQTIKELGVKTEYGCQIGIYKESLLPIEGINI